MSLLLERRDLSGNAVGTSRFVDGITVNGDITLTVEQACELAKVSSREPSEKRTWILRIGFKD